MVKSLFAKSIWIIGFSGAKEGRVLIMVISYTGSLFMPILQNMDDDCRISSALFILLLFQAERGKFPGS